MTAPLAPVGKACPVVLRERLGLAEILVFRHPKAGMQLVKGTIEAGEMPVDAARRELLEEAGISLLGDCRELGSDSRISDGQIWHFVLCPVGELPDSWTFHTLDDGGHDFAFSWHRLDELPNPSSWHPVFIRALGAIIKLVAGAGAAGSAIRF